MKRVSTFGATLWFGKPLLLSPLECARYGWANAAKDTLKCSMCNATLVCKFSPSLTSHGASQTAALYHTQLSQGHQTWCAWRDSACPEELARLPKHPQDLCLSAQHRFESGVRCDALPVLQPSFMAVWQEELKECRKDRSLAAAF